MNRKLIFLLSASMLLSFLMSFKEYSGFNLFYTSETKVEYNDGTNSLEFTTKLFTKSVEGAFDMKVDDPDFDSYMKNYLSKNVKVFVNGVSHTIHFTGKQITPKTLRIFYEVLNVGKKIKTIEIHNALLIRNFSEQQNFVALEIGDHSSSFTCEKGKEAGRVQF